MTSRITQQQLESYLWGAATLLRGTIDAGDYKQFIFPLLFFKRLCDVFDEETRIALKESGGDKKFAAYPENHRFQIPPEAQWREVRQVGKNVGQALQNAMRSIETANQEKLYGIFGDAQWTNKDRLPDAMLRNLIEHFSSLELTIANLPEDELGQGYEFLIKKFADDSGHTAAEFYTNRTVVHLMTEMLEVQPGESVYDPTCGSGGMLLSCVAQLRHQKKEWRNVKLFGQERNLMTSSIARMNCFLHGIEDFRIERGDTLAEPKFLQGDRLMRFDVCLANPPYSIKQWDREAFASDPWGRNLYGTPPQGNADYAFFQHILASLAPKTGRCAILFPHGVLFRDAEDEMRRKLIEADLIECVVGLGMNLFYNSSMPACVIICRTSKPKTRKGKILLINAVNEVSRERAQSYLTEAHIERIVGAYRGFSNEPGLARTVSMEEVRANRGNLNLAMYVSTTATPTHSSSKVAATVSNAVGSWLKSRRQMAEALGYLLGRPATRFPGSDLEYSGKSFLLNNRKAWKKIRLGDLLEKTEETEQNPLSVGLDRYLLVEHLDADCLRIKRWGDISDGNIPPTFYKIFRKGQILYPTRNPQLRRAAFADFDGICGEKTLTLSVRDGTDPRFLAFIFQAKNFIAFTTDRKIGSTNPHIRWRDVADFEFDIPPLELQQRIANVLWALDETIEGYRSALTAARAAVRSECEDFFSTNLNGKWPTVSMEEICTAQQGQVDPKQAPYSEMIHIAPDDIEGDSGLILEQRTAREDKIISGKYEFTDEAILYCKIRPYLKKVAFPRFAGICSADMYPLYPKPNVLPEFLFRLLLSEGFTKYAIMHSARSAFPKLNREALFAFRLALPPINEQRRFIQRVNKVAHASETLGDYIKTLRRIHESFTNSIAA